MANAIAQGLMGAASGFFLGRAKEIDEERRSAAEERKIQAQAQMQRALEEIKQREQTKRTELQEEGRWGRAEMKEEGADRRAKEAAESKMELERFKEGGRNARAASSRETDDPFGPRKMYERADITARELGKTVEQRLSSLTDFSGMSESSRERARKVLASEYGLDENKPWREQYQQLRGILRDEVESSYTELRDRQIEGFRGPPAAQEPPAAPTSSQPAAPAATPYTEGTRLRGPDGKTYVVRNGVPVPI